MDSFLRNLPGISMSYDLDELPQAKSFSMHTHALFEIYCFLQGKGIYHIEGSEYLLQSGDILIMRPGEAHYFECDPRHPYERISLHVDTRFFSAIDPENQLTRPIFSRKPGKQNLYRSNDFGSNAYMGYIRNILLPSANQLSILANLILLMQEIGRLFDSTPPVSESDSLEYRLISYINRHLDAPLSLPMLCDHFYISQPQLCRRFKRVTGTSIGKYITAKRLLAARQLIIQGQKPTDIYHTIGYQDYSTFYRAYCSYFGHCPRDDQQKIVTSDRYEIK